MIGGKNNNEESKKGKKVRNFNFRCNLEEIDKIIEEENEKGPEESSEPFIIQNKPKKEGSITRIK